MLLTESTKNRLKLQQAQCYLECIDELASPDEVQKLKWAAIYLIQLVAQGAQPLNFKAVVEKANEYTMRQLQ
jgi:hypothetical protein